MADFSELLNTIKQAASEAVEAEKPVNVCFGKVTSESPLQILVDQKMTLGSAQLVLARNVTTYTVKIDVQWESDVENQAHNHVLKDIITDDGAKIENGYTETETSTHIHNIEGTKEMTFHNELHVGDEVIMFRMQGGQKYIVLDRIGGV